MGGRRGGDSPSSTFAENISSTTKTWLRFGRFVGAHPRVMAITLHTDMDLVDRPGIAAVWARGTIGADARDYGG